MQFSANILKIVEVHSELISCSRRSHRMRAFELLFTCAHRCVYGFFFPYEDKKRLYMKIEYKVKHAIAQNKGTKREQTNELRRRCDDDDKSTPPPVQPFRAVYFFLLGHFLVFLSTIFAAAFVPLFSSFSFSLFLSLALHIRIMFLSYTYSVCTLYGWCVLCSRIYPGLYTYI